MTEWTECVKIDVVITTRSASGKEKRCCLDSVYSFKDSWIAYLFSESEWRRFEW